MSRVLIIEDLNNNDSLCSIQEEILCHCRTLVPDIEVECNDDNSLLVKFEEEDEDLEEVESSLLPDLYSTISYILSNNEYYNYSINLN